MEGLSVVGQVWSGVVRRVAPGGGDGSWEEGSSSIGLDRCWWRVEKSGGEPGRANGSARGPATDAQRRAQAIESRSGVEQSSLSGKGAKCDGVRRGG